MVIGRWETSEDPGATASVVAIGGGLGSLTFAHPLEVLFAYVQLAYLAPFAIIYGRRHA